MAMDLLSFTSCPERSNTILKVNKSKITWNILKLFHYSPSRILNMMWQISNTLLSRWRLLLSGPHCSTIATEMMVWKQVCCREKESERDRSEKKTDENRTVSVYVGMFSCACVRMRISFEREERAEKERARRKTESVKRENTPSNVEWDCKRCVVQNLNGLHCQIWGFSIPIPRPKGWAHTH